MDMLCRALPPLLQLPARPLGVRTRVKGAEPGQRKRAFGLHDELHITELSYNIFPAGNVQKNEPQLTAPEGTFS